MKALVVGGNSGLGLSLVCNLLKQGYDKVYIIGKDDLNYYDIDESFRNEFFKKTIVYKVNFTLGDYSILNEINDINALFITLGFGRVALFENLIDSEINNLIKVNLSSVVRIIKHYYNSINSDNDFYTSVISSICGRIVSPFFSVYSASKAGLRFFVESVNCELEANGKSNRILDVSPGSISGTGFNGGKTKLDLIDELSREIIYRTFNKECLYIPKYDEIYKNVIEKYQNNPHDFALESYNYKKESNRKNDKPQITVGYLSGTFDLFHIGHLNLLRRARAECDYLIVSVHSSGAWKGKETFIPYEERKAIVESIKYVDKVVDDYLEDIDAWNDFHYDKLFVGSDYKGTERFERYEIFLKDKAEIVYFPYTIGTSSTQLRNRLKEKK